MLEMFDLTGRVAVVTGGNRGIGLCMARGNGQDPLIVSGHQLRSDRLRIVFDRESLIADGKSLRFASGEYTDESLRDRVLLRAD